MHLTCKNHLFTKLAINECTRLPSSCHYQLRCWPCSISSRARQYVPKLVHGYRNLVQLAKTSRGSHCTCYGDILHICIIQSSVQSQSPRSLCMLLPQFRSDPEAMHACPHQLSRLPFGKPALPVGSLGTRRLWLFWPPLLLHWSA